MTSFTNDSGDDTGPAGAKPTSASPAVRVDPEIVAERVGESVVLVHLGTDQIYELNVTAGRIFELLRAGAERAEIVAQLTAEFEIDRASVERQLDALVAALRERGVVR